MRHNDGYKKNKKKSETIIKVKVKEENAQLKIEGNPVEKFEISDGLPEDHPLAHRDI